MSRTIEQGTQFALICGFAAWVVLGPPAMVAQSQPTPTAPVQTPAPSYVIGQGDVLQIDVWMEPEASGAVVVRPDGKISVPVIKEIVAEGLTPADLERQLTEKFSKLIVDANVTVVVREIHSARVYMLGEVRKEGSVAIQGPMTVLQAISEAGGLSEYAKRNSIYILRGQTRIRFDYNGAIRGDHPEQNILLRPGDIIQVP
jgi:polysaccharide export outer membrane protein